MPYHWYENVASDLALHGSSTLGFDFSQLNADVGWQQGYAVEYNGAPVALTGGQNLQLTFDTAYVGAANVTTPIVDSQDTHENDYVVAAAQGLALRRTGLWQLYVEIDFDAVLSASGSFIDSFYPGGAGRFYIPAGARNLVQTLLVAANADDTARVQCSMGVSIPTGVTGLHVTYAVIAAAPILVS